MFTTLESNDPLFEHEQENNHYQFYKESVANANQHSFGNSLANA